MGFVGGFLFVVLWLGAVYTLVYTIGQTQCWLNISEFVDFLLNRESGKLCRKGYYIALVFLVCRLSVSKENRRIFSGSFSLFFIDTM